MDKDEKTLLLQLILEDIRGNWGWDLEHRIEEALDLAMELDLKQHIEKIQDFLGDMETGDQDGRIFNEDYEDGGYGNIKELHGLSPSILDKSIAFQINAENVLTYPENRFIDWDRYEGNIGDL